MKFRTKLTLINCIILQAMRLYKLPCIVLSLKGHLRLASALAHRTEVLANRAPLVGLFDISSLITYYHFSLKINDSKYKFTHKSGII